MCGVFVEATASSSSYSTNHYTTSLGASSYGESSSLSATFLTSEDGTTNDGQGTTYLAGIGFFGHSSNSNAVSIDSYSIYPPSSIPGSIIRLGIVASHAESVWARITLPNGTQTFITLVNNDYAYYTTPQLEGRYDVIFYANDSSGSIASALDYFDIATPVTPSSGSGSSSSGSSSSGSLLSCSPIWECTGWSICAGGMQTRSCTDSQACPSVLDHPLESRSCENRRANITFISGRLELTREGYLEFYLNITQRGDTEKANVLIKYAVLNVTGGEIFSQIETRTVEESTRFLKRLELPRLQPGTYTLQITYIYGNLQEGFREQVFAIEQDGSFREVGNVVLLPGGAGASSYNMWIGIGGIVAFLISLILFVITLVKRKKRGPVFVPTSTRMRESSIHSPTAVRSAPSAHLKGLLLSKQHGKKVYSDHGTLMGVIKDMYLEENCVYGFIIEPTKELHRRMHSSSIMVRYKHIASVGDVIILKGSLEDYQGEE